MMDPILSVDHVTRRYRSGDHEITVLDAVSFDIEPAATVSIVGPSGSGKTTLLGLCAGLDRPSSGEVMLAGQRLSTLSEDQRAALRGKVTGFVFQSFQLIPTLTALENVLVPLELNGAHADVGQALALLERVGLGERHHHYPNQLSGGEQQRVALARAFINRPKILFADEPTGNLDRDTGATIESLLFELNTEAGTTLVIVTHDRFLAHKTGRIIALDRGKIEQDMPTQQPTGVGYE